MDSPGCYLGLGMVLGVLIGALFAEGARRQRAAMAKIRAVETEKEKADGIMQKARDKRREGYSELPGAYLMILIASGLLILAVYLMLAGESF
jgi:Na+/glutamate symporter